MNCTGGTFKVFETVCIRSTSHCITTRRSTDLSMYKFCVNSACLVTWLIDGRRACLCITTGITATLSRYGVCGTSTCLVSRLSDGHWHIDDLFVHVFRDALLELFRSLWHCHIDDLGALCHRLESAFHDLR